MAGVQSGRLGRGTAASRATRRARAALRGDDIRGQSQFWLATAYTERPRSSRGWDALVPRGALVTRQRAPVLAGAALSAPRASAHSCAATSSGVSALRVDCLLRPPI
jgi:hypothetical protein